MHFLLFALFSFAVSQAKPLGWAANAELNFDSTDESFHYRSLSTSTWSLLGWSGVWYGSVQTNVETKQPIANGDFIWGSVYIGRNEYPLNWQGYWAASVSNHTPIDPSKANWQNFDVSLTSSFVASVYLKLVEKNSTGAFVGEKTLDTVWSYDKATSTELTNKTAGLYASVFDTTLSNGATVELQYILTEQSGVLDVLTGVQVVPKGVETIVLINNWPYQSEDNTLTLVLAAGSSSMDVNVDGQVTSGSGDDAVFFRVAKEAQIDGKIEATKVTASGSSDIEATFGKSGVTTQLTGRYGKTASCGIFTVEFPAGAKEIVYDPSMGSGENPFEEPSNLLMVIALSITGAFIVLFIAGVALYQYRKRVQYKSI
eukprot:TRINITY_DN10473_c0_g1_i1.p1 TRINITY_DN10473_c0_g1~~TRINITY_DN10473_c0_g1_i1.p1  ORF type:complete len:371 (-),score=83.35 TRINITY_DN10473_c0_g1_i1:44-1156(-)